MKRPVRQSRRRRASPEPRDPADHQPLVTALGGGTLTFEAMLAIADLLPVMIGYVDRDFIYRFVNRPIADWLELPRSEILGHSMEDILGEQSFAERRPLLEAALARGTPVLRKRDPAPQPRPRRRPDRLCALGRSERRGARADPAGHRRDGTANRGTRIARKRGPLPPNRQLRSRADVGHPPRPRPRFRQRCLCRLRRRPGRRPGGGADGRLAQPNPSRRCRPRRRRQALPGRRRCSRSRWKPATCATTASIAGCAASRSPASAPTASSAASSA